MQFAEPYLALLVFMLSTGEAMVNRLPELAEGDRASRRDGRRCAKGERYRTDSYFGTWSVPGREA